MSITGWFKLRNLGDGIRMFDFADDEYGTNALLLTNSQNSNTGNWTVVNSLGNQLGWTVSTLSGDTDSNISSEYEYSCAVNLHGTNQTVNGVPFEGTTASSGNGWALTAGFGASHSGTTNTSVSGTIGNILKQGFKFSGDPQKIMLSGLTDGRTYRFSIYSQSWGGNRFCELSCSDLPGSITVDQDQNHNQNPDGLLVECTYIAEGTDVEFTIDPVSSGHTWHLYAFSNRVEPSDRNESEILVDSFWKLNEWQHLGITIEEDGQTKFFSDGDFISSKQGNVPADLNRSFHILGGNRLGMDQFNPIDLEGLKLWLDARYGHTVFIDGEATTIASEEGDNIAIWKDLSGNGHDALSTEGTPTWQPFGFNELPTLFFDYNTQMTVQNSSEEFDGWSKLSVYAVLEEKSIKCLELLVR